MRPRHALYVHGFASSANSSKAMYLAARLAPHGIELRCPDLNLPDFATLTITRMVEQIEAEVRSLPPGPVVLIGSSLGAFVALHVASRAESANSAVEAGRPIHRLVLLAPAVRFSLSEDPRVGPRVPAWKETNGLDVFHYGYGELRSLQFAMFEDAERYRQAPLRVSIPVLIFQGRRDETIDPAAVERFARERPNVTLRLLDDGHQLLGSLEEIWLGTAPFLELEV